MFELQPQRFILRLYSVVASEDAPSISWSLSGSSFLITDKPAFTRETMPKLCKTDDYSTFVRQLNNYGFTKVKPNLTQFDEFSNPHFVRDRPDLLPMIRRKMGGAEDKNLLSNEIKALRRDQYTLQNNMVHIDTSHSELLNEMYFLKQKVEMQDRTIKELVRVILNAFKGRGVERERLKLETPVKAIERALLEDGKKTSDEELEDLGDFLGLSYDEQSRNSEDR